MKTDAPSTVVGILYGGELGSSLGGLLTNTDVTVVTTTQGRSHRTRTLVSEAGLKSLPTLRDVVAASDIIISLVTPSSAVDVARRFAEVVGVDGTNPDIFIDMNSTSPQTADRINGIIGETGVRFCDAAVQGLASKLRTGGTLFLSGEAAADAAPLFSGALRTRDLGTEAGRASLMKMLLGGFTKSLGASFLVLALLSRSSSIAGEFLAAFRMQYPEIMPVLERLLPTYPQHSGRRAEEMIELADTLRLAGLPTWFADSAQQTFACLAETDLKQQWLAVDERADLPYGADHLRFLVELVHQVAPFDQSGAGNAADDIQDVT